MKRKGKSIVSCLLVLALLLGMVPSMTPTAYAATHTHDGTNFSAWNNWTYLPTREGDYYLTCDVTLSAPWFPPSGMTRLCLNGYNITQRNGNSVIHLTSCGLYVYDCKDCGKITGGRMTRGGGVYVECGAVFCLYGGVIQDNTATGVNSNGTLIAVTTTTWF